MSIYALGDLHLSFNKAVSLHNIDAHQDQYKPMDVFGWERHFDRIRDNWLKKVTEDDTVLIPGDISWAMKVEQAKYDFGWIDQLPGRKVLSPGNHCYYASSKNKVRQALPARMDWLDGDCTLVENYVVAGTRGWILPHDPSWDETSDRKIYERQAGRLRLALESAKQHYPNYPIIVMLHFPPVTTSMLHSDFFDLLQQYGVELCVYGHLHGNGHRFAVNGEVNGVELRLVSCDYLDFSPILVR